MNKTLKRSKLIKNRLVQVLEANEVMLHDELEIVEHICKRLNLLPMSKAAEALGISYNGLKMRIEKEQVMTVNINGLTLISVKKEDR